MAAATGGAVLITGTHSKRRSGGKSAYGELLVTSPTAQPDLGIVFRACGVLTAFGAGFLALAWGLLRLD